MMQFTDEEIKTRLEKLRLELDEEEGGSFTSEEISLADSMAVGRPELENSADLDVGCNLADIEIDQWGVISVSPLSTFSNNTWDFSNFPCPSGRSRVNFDYDNCHGFNAANASKHWLMIFKALIFYRIPRYSFSGLNRSYGAVPAAKSRFLSLLKFFDKYGLYVEGVNDLAPSRTIDDLSKETVDEYLKERPSAMLRWEFGAAIHYWQKLSRSRMLPLIYAVSGEFVTDEEISKLRQEADQATEAFEPIALDAYAHIISYSSSMVVGYAEDLLWLARTYFPTLIGVGRGAHSVGEGLSCASPEGVAAFRAYTPVQVSGRPWWSIEVLERSHPRDSGEYLSYAQVASHVQALFDCAITMIFATTGMRRSELWYLKANCTCTDDAGHWLTFTVFKTSDASQGEIKRIPIPPVTFQAIEVLRTLCGPSRDYGRHDYLLSSITRAHFGKHPNGVFAERALSRVASACGIDDNLHSHRFRKSLAMYIIYQDSRNIELIRHLFSHKSLRMTLRYILSLPGVNEELKRYLIKQNSDILSEVLAAAASERIGGKGGLRIKEGLLKSKIFSGRLQDHGKETLEQYIDSLLDSGIKLLHRSNLAICIRSPSVNDTVPCVGKDEGAASRLHPNLFACDPFNCRFSVFTEGHTDSLKSEVLFHERLLTHPYCGDKQLQFSVRRIREANSELQRVTRATGAEPSVRYG